MPDTKTAAVICHARFLDLASFGEILGQKGYEVRYYDAGQDSLALDGAPDVLITLGGPVGACERSDYPWIDDEMEVLGKHLSAGRPLLAICLGAQILAQTLGARVQKFAGDWLGSYRADQRRSAERFEAHRRGGRPCTSLAWRFV